MENAPQYVIEMLHITKEFPGIRANDDITLQLRKGEIHALLGENGAGEVDADVYPLWDVSARCWRDPQGWKTSDPSKTPTMPRPWALVWCISILS